MRKRDLVLITTALMLVSSIVVATTYKPLRSAGGVEMTPETTWAGKPGSEGVYIRGDAGVTYHKADNSETVLGSGGGGGGSGMTLVDQNETLAIGAGTVSTSSSTFGQIGNGSSDGFADYTTASLSAGDYVIAWEITEIYGSSGASKAEFHVLVDGSAPSGQPLGRFYVQTNAVNGTGRMIKVTGLSTGTHTLRLEWKAVTGTVALDGGYASLCWTVFKQS